MLENLIRAYRTEIYDWSASKWWALIKRNKKLFSIFILFLILIIVPLVLYFIYTSPLWLLLMLFLEGIEYIVLERYTSINYQQFLKKNQNHIEDTISLLKTALSPQSLYSQKQIDMLIERLTERIDSQVPFKNFLTALRNFAKAVIVPIIAFIAGLYAGNLKQFGFTNIVRWSVILILFLGVICLAWWGLSSVLRSITYRNYNAAVALREDLRDIKLLYFCETENELSIIKKPWA